MTIKEIVAIAKELPYCEIRERIVNETIDYIRINSEKEKKLNDNI